MGAGSVQLGGGAIGVHHGDVRANRLTGRQVRKLDIHRRQSGQHRVGGLAGHNSHGRNTGNLQRARNIHALAARILHGTDGTLHGAVGQGRAELNRAVQAGVSGQGNNH